MRKAARYIAKAPTEVALYSLRQIAARAEVGQTTLDIAAAGQIMKKARRLYILGLRCNYSLCLPSATSHMRLTQ